MRHGRASIGVLVLVPAAACAWPAAALHAQPARSTAAVFDRTLLCQTSAIGGGLYELEVWAQDGIRQTRTTWKSLAFAAVASGRIASRAAVLENALTWAGAGRYVHETNLHEAAEPLPPDREGTLAYSQRVCRRSSARVPFSGRGLSGGRAGPFTARYDCFVPRQVLVRVRAVLPAPPPLFRVTGFLRTRMRLESASLAVRTPAGRRIALATVSSSGKAVLLTARDCVPE